MAKIKIPWKPLLAVVLVLVLSWSGYVYYLNNIKIIPEELLAEVMQRTETTNSYRYHVKVTLLGTDTGNNVLSNLDGENSKDNFHIWGEMAKEQIEVFQVGNTTYAKRMEDARWMKTPGNNPFEQTLFMAELNPLASFDFNSYSELEYLGKEKIDGKKLYLLTYQPKLGEELLTMYFTDFKYKIWVDRGRREIRHAQIEATSKISSKGGLKMEVKIWDYNKPIEIKPPEDS